MTDSDYLEQFHTLVVVCNTTDCKIGEFRILATEYLVQQGTDPESPTVEQQQAALEVAKEKYPTIAFLLSADRSCYRKMVDKLTNKFLQGDKEAFPVTVTDAHRNLVHWRSNPRFQSRNANIVGTEGVAYTQYGNQRKGNGRGGGISQKYQGCDQRSSSNSSGSRGPNNYKYYNWGEWGHISFEYPNTKQASKS